jgi:hypothetical protein
MAARFKTSFNKLLQMIFEVYSNDTILLTGMYAVPRFASHKLLLEEGILNDLFLA